MSQAPDNNKPEENDDLKALQTRYIGIGLGLGSGLGIALGTVLGTLTDTIGLWLPIGVAMGNSMGLALGAALFVAEKKRRENEESGAVIDTKESKQDTEPKN